MKIGLVGPSYVERSLPFDAQRCINLYPVIDESSQGKEVSALYGTPGLSLFATAGNGPIRGEFSSANGRGFAVSASTLYEIDSSGNATSLGTLATDSSICSFSENPTQLAICDGQNVYILEYSTNTFTQVTSSFQGGGTITFLNGYFIVNKPGSGQFYISGLYGGLTWAALDFATAESSPDNLARVFSTFGQLWLLGDRTTEVWYDSGGVDFPFAKMQGANMETGCAAAHSVVNMDNTIIWLGKDKDGQGIVYRAQGYSPLRISTHAIEYAINKSSDLSGIRAFTYQQDGHVFYVLTGGGLATTLVYDASTKLWHERAYLESDGSLSIHRGITCMFAFNKHLVGDRSNGNIYQMSQDFFSDNGDAIIAQRTFPHLFNEAKPFRLNELEVDFETGVGLMTGQGSAPVAWLEISEDGARTWSRQYQTSIGPIGAFKTRAVWRRLGMAQRTGQVTFRVTITDPVKKSICGAYLK